MPGLAADFQPESAMASTPASALRRLWVASVLAICDYGRLMDDLWATYGRFLLPECKRYGPSWWQLHGVEPMAAEIGCIQKTQKNEISSSLNKL